MKKWFGRMICVVLCCMRLFACVAAQEAAVQDDALIFSSKNQGMCKQMTGDVQALVVFADTDEKSWTDDKKQKKMIILEQAASLLEEQAASYGKELRFHFTFVHTNPSFLPDVTNPDTWVEACLMESFDYLKLALDMDGKENTLTIFCIAEDGRSMAFADGEEYPQEYIITYDDDQAENCMHELLHLFGAQDYYYPDAYHAAAMQYFPDSIMLEPKAGNRADSLTAYLIGWTDEMDASALSFVQQTAHVTNEDIEMGLSRSIYTGYAMLETESNVYYGMLSEGQKEGNGVLRWQTGDRYTGEFKNGRMHGWGTYEWAGGNCYCGQYENGKRCGSGTYFWPDGSRYTGDFLDGAFHGQGVHQYANGDMYVGEYENNAKSGYGMYVWKDGSTYIGEFDHDQFHGSGVYKGWDGTVMEGQWTNGEYQNK